MSDLEIVEETGRSVEASVTQDNALVSASYRLTLDAKRVLLLGISKIDSKEKLWLKGEHTVRIYADEWRDYYGTRLDNTYSQMRAGMDALYDATVVVKNTADEGHEFRWLNEKAYKWGEGWLEITFTKNVLIYLNSLFSTFTTYKLLNVGGLRSIHSIRIYELLSQFRSTGWRLIRYEDLRSALGLEEDQYTRFTDFKKRVLDTAVKEISSKTDLVISKCAVERRGRKVQTIKFEFSVKTQMKLNLADEVSQGDRVERQTEKLNSEIMEGRGREMIEALKRDKADIGTDDIMEGLKFGSD